ncbi:MAG TPA: helix-turn-helix domain-containing protein [Mollicutes bacterium]|nr:helix-turn-helix domain-containing protein [Mollicutes bacterium]
MNNKREKPSYYAILPAVVRYDSDLTPGAKLLYAEISSLCNEKGYCWATNRYFCELYSITDRTIRNLLKQLSNKNYIKIEHISGIERQIFISDGIKYQKELKKITIPDYNWLEEEE